MRHRARVRDLTPLLDREQLLALAERADVDLRTLARRLRGHAVLGRGARRIERAAVELGIDLPVVVRVA